MAAGRGRGGLPQMPSLMTLESTGHGMILFSIVTVGGDKIKDLSKEMAGRIQTIQISALHSCEGFQPP